MMQTSSTTSRVAVEVTPEETPDPLVRFAGTPRRALIAGEHTLGMLCALLRRGCPEAATIRPNEKPDAAEYDLLVLPDAAAFSSPDEIVRLARRVLALNGRLVARLPTAAALAALARRLRLNGFAVATVHGRLLRAERRGDLGRNVA